MKITICGSMHHIKEMKKAAKTLATRGYEVTIPDPREGEADYNTLPANEQAALKSTLIREHLNNITDSDAVFIYNGEKNGIDGYIGGNTLMEMAFAYAQHLEIFMLHPAPDLSYKDEIEGMEPISLNGEVMAIDSYFGSLPKTFVSSKSPVKLRAVSRGLRKAKIRTQVLAHPTSSGVNEQPLSIEETYEGARNRHNKLSEETADKQPAYLATVESGNHAVHPDHNPFGCAVIILQKVGSQPRVGIDLDIEFPKEMVDKVPRFYPDFGILVQQEYGSTLKDPYPFFTGGKVSRLKLMEDAVFNVAAQL